MLALAAGCGRNGEPQHEPQANDTVYTAEAAMKITADYSAAILGLWECQELTGIETYNDANARLEFFDDGTTDQQGMRWTKVNYYR